MGTVIQFHPRQPDSAARAATILERISQLQREQERAREALPRVLAQLAQAGETEAVLRAVCLWGSGEVEPREVLAMCEEIGAVAGVRPVGERPFCR